MAIDTLGRSEAIVLGVLANRPHGAHGTAMLDDLAKLTDREWSVGALYTTLERLEKKGFATATWAEATPQRGGRRKRVYQVSAAGRAALRDMHELMNKVTAAPTFGLRPVEI